MVKKRPRKRFRPRKIDGCSAHEKWLFKMAKRPLYDLLPRNSEIHNFTSLKLTERQGRVLGMGLKFRPSLLPPSESYKSKTSVEEFASRINSPTARQTRTSIPDCTFQQAEIRRGKIPILKTNSSRYAKSCLKTLWLANRIGRTTSQSTSERNLAS